MCGSQPDVFKAFVRIADELLPSWQKALALPPTGFEGLVDGWALPEQSRGGNGSWHKVADVGHGSYLREKVLLWIS